MSDRAGEPGPLPTSGKNPRHPRKSQNVPALAQQQSASFPRTLPRKRTCPVPVLWGFFWG